MIRRPFLLFGLIAFPFLLSLCFSQFPNWYSSSHKPTNYDSDIKLIELSFDTKSVVIFNDILNHTRKLNARDEKSRNWVNVTLRHGKQNFPAKVRLRGNTKNHWVSDKVSFRVVLREGYAFQKLRHFNLIIPSDRMYFMELFAEFLGKKLGLLTAHNELVWVKANGLDMGYYLLQSDFDKNLLEIRGTAYSQFYRSADTHFDLSRRGVDFTDRNLVYNLPMWNQKNEKAPNSLAVASRLDELLQIFRSHKKLSLKDYHRIQHLLDTDKLASVNALSKITSGHADMIHNFVFLFDSTRALFEPIFLDPTLWNYNVEGFDVVGRGSWAVFSNELLELKVFRDRRNAKLRKILAIEKDFWDYFNKWDAFSPKLAKDKYLMLPTALIAPKIDPRKIPDYMDGFRKKFENNFATIRKYLDVADSQVYQADHPKVPDIKRPVVHVTSVSHVDRTQLKFTHSPPSTKVQLFHLEVRGKGVDSVHISKSWTRRYEKGLLQLSLKAPLDLSSIEKIDLIGFDPSRMQIFPSLRGEDGKSLSELDVRVAYEDRRRSAFAFLSDSWESEIQQKSNLKFIKNANRWILKPGQYRVEKTVVFPDIGTLEIPPGTTIQFSPGASLISYARLRVKGTSKKPVILEAKDAAKGWGLLAVLSTNLRQPGTRSEIEHLVYKDSRGGVINGIAYTGGLSLFDSDVSIRHSIFVNSGLDDGLNTKKSVVDISDNVFIRSPSDGMDVDWGSGRISGNLIIATGGDAIDLSGARNLEVSRNIIYGVKDKGFSVGEDSQARLVGNLVAFSKTGVASKDLSEVHSVSNFLLHNETCFSGYQKKIIFGPARLFSKKDRLINCGLESQAEVGSQIQIAGATRSTPFRGDDGVSATTLSEVLSHLKNLSKHTGISVWGLEHQEWKKHIGKPHEYNLS